MEGLLWRTPCGEEASVREVVWHSSSLVAAFAAAQPCGLHSTRLPTVSKQLSVCKRAQLQTLAKGARHERPAHWPGVHRQA